MLRGIAITLGSAVMALGLFATGAWAQDCPNEAIRQEQHATGLPDCRAYEQVSPADKNGVDVSNDWGQLSAADGAHFAFGAFGAFGDARSGPLASPYIAVRSATGWTTRSASVPLKPGTFEGVARYFQYSSDFTKALFQYNPPEADPGLVPGGDSGTSLYQSTIGADSYQLVGNDPLGLVGNDPVGFLSFQGASADLSRVFFASSHSLLPGVPDPPMASISAGYQLYERVDGVLRLASVQPDGTPTPDPIDPVQAPHQIAVSTDGTRYAYRAGEHVYVTDHGTTRILAPTFASNVTTFIRATPDLSHIFLFVTDLGIPAPIATWDYDTASGQLTSLPVQASALNVAAFQGVSDDGSRLYVQTPAQLAPGTGTPGASNLYLLHGGAAGYVGSGAGVTVSPDGDHFVFSSTDPLTGYDAGGHVEFFEYDATTRHVSCLSCSPTGARATGNPVTGWPSVTLNLGGPAGHRNLSADGRRFFFSSPDALVPGDVNGKYDAYENVDGTIELLSSGRDGDDSFFTDASASGDDAFIATRQRLTSTDTDNNIDFYDARAGGGFPTATALPACLGDECQGQPSDAPPRTALASASLFGQGNLVPAFSNPPARAATRAQLLARALKTCRAKHNKRRRVRCETLAREKYGAKPHVSKKSKKSKTAKGRQ